jgi:hypothetical protein
MGSAADDLPTLAVLLGLISESGNTLESTDDAVRTTAITELRKRMIDRDPYVDDSAFWDEVFESLD